LGSNGLAVFLDTAIGQEVTDLGQVRGRFRPGYINGALAFLVDVEIQFRF
jgi:hypothetical protein